MINPYTTLREADEPTAEQRRRPRRMSRAPTRAKLPEPTTSLATIDSAAANTIGHHFRRHRLVFSQLGPTIFCRKGGGLADYGTLYFPEKNNHAPFITISDTTSSMLLSNFMQKYWKVDRPDLIISVTGGAQDFVLNSRLKRVFDRGLTSAAASTNAWVITGGTDTGVMKLVASAFVEYGVTTPLIAVTSYGCVKGRDAFDGSRGESSTYTCFEGASAEGAPLNPQHTHYVFVDNGKVAPQAWGGEIGLRANLESTYCMTKGIPMVLLVAQGGPGTLQTVLASAKQSQAILIVKGSGGAADAVADYVEKGATRDPKFTTEKLQATLAEIKALQEDSGGRVLTIFSLDQDVEMSTMLLRALTKMLAPAPAASAGTPVHKEEPSAPAFKEEKSKRGSNGPAEETLGRALILAVNWNRVDIAADLLRDMSAALRFTYGHHFALQFVLEKQRTQLLRLLVACPGFTVTGVNMARLYMVDDKYNVLKSDSALQKRISENTKSISQMLRDKTTGGPTNTHALYETIVGPFLCSIMPQLAGPLRQKHVTPLDLFFWAIVIGNDDLIFEFWKRTANPVRAALWGSHMARRLTEMIQFGKDECLKRADRLESWANGILEVVPSSLEGFAILGHTVPQWGASSLLDTGMQFGMKKFLSHKHCQSMVDAIWRGDLEGSITLPKDFNFLAFCLYVFLPPINPYLYGKVEEESLGSRRNLDISTITEAVMHTHRLAKEETLRAGGTNQPGILAPSDALKSSDPIDSLSPRFAAIVRMARINDIQKLAAEEEGLAGEHEDAETHADTSVVDLFKEFYAIPATKFVVRLAVHLLMLANYAQLLVTVSTMNTVTVHGVPPFKWQEYLFAGQVVGNYLDQLHQKLMLKQRRIKPMQNFGSLLDFGEFLLLTAGLFRLLAATGHHMSTMHINFYIIFQVTLSCAVVIISIRTIDFRAVSQDFGVLVIMVERMINDLILFIELFVLIILGFVLSFVGLSEWHEEGDFFSDRRALKDNSDNGPPMDGPWAVIQATFWATYGDFDLDMFADEVPFGQPVLFVYVLVSTIILVNLLVAMFSDTYVKIKANSELEYRFHKCNRIYLYNNIVLPVPPPFNLPLILPDLLEDWRSWCGGRRKAQVNPYHVDASADDSQSTDNKLATRFIEPYLRVKEAEEASTAYGLQVRMNERSQVMQHVQDTTIDMLKDIAASLGGLKMEVTTKDGAVTSIARASSSSGSMNPGAYAKEDSVKQLEKTVTLVGGAVDNLSSSLADISARLALLTKEGGSPRSTASTPNFASTFLDAKGGKGRFC